MSMVRRDARPRGPAARSVDRRQSGISPSTGGRHAAGRRASAHSMRSTSAAAPTAAGGCSATARRRRPAPAMHSKTGSRCRARSRTSIARTKVERVAPFFQALAGRSVRASTARMTARVCLLTPGPMNETYFEHAYLARYLGMLLVEGEDLTVRDDGVFIRTVSGLRARRGAAAAARCRFRRSARAQCARRGSASPASFRPCATARSSSPTRLAPASPKRARCSPSCRRWRPPCSGTDLAFPNVATWWLGQSDVRDEMIDRLDSMVIAPAFGDAPTDARSATACSASSSTRPTRADLLQCDRRPRRGLRRAGSRDAVDHAGVA